METIKNNVKESDANKLTEMLRIAVQFEEATYAAASSMDDYLRKISSRLSYLETKNQPPAPINPEFRTSASRPSAQINPNLSSSASNVSGLPKLGFMNQNHRHTGNIGATDWQEEGYQKLQSMKEQYLTELNEVLAKTKLKLQQLESLVPSEKHAEQLRILKDLIVKLDRAKVFLMLPKDKITVNMLKGIARYEEDISKFLCRYRQRKLAQANQPQEIQLEASETSSRQQNILTCATNTLQSNVGPVQASSSLLQLDSIELDYLRIKHRSSTDPRVYDYSAGQRQNYYNQLVKEVAPCQNVPVSLPQNCHKSSFKTEDSVILSSSPSSKLPAESASSPLVDNERQK